MLNFLHVFLPHSLISSELFLIVSLSIICLIIQPSLPSFTSIILGCLASRPPLAFTHKQVESLRHSLLRTLLLFLICLLPLLLLPLPLMPTLPRLQLFSVTLPRHTNNKRNTFFCQVVLQNISNDLAKKLKTAPFKKCG